MSSKAQQIAEHFRTHGTPIMIGMDPHSNSNVRGIFHSMTLIIFYIFIAGGGVLAHTIIGIDFKEDTADARFLILDPHYTGGEDLRVIQNKGWCNWKPSSFWKADSFYNMCLPLRPTSF